MDFAYVTALQKHKLIISQRRITMNMLDKMSSAVMINAA
jgi:hypothetical protein